MNFIIITDNIKSWMQIKGRPTSDYTIMSIIVDYQNVYTKVIVRLLRLHSLFVSQKFGKREPLSENGAKVKIMILTNEGYMLRCYLGLEFRGRR